MIIRKNSSKERLKHEISNLKFEIKKYESALKSLTYNFNRTANLYNKEIVSKKERLSEMTTRFKEKM